MTETNDTSSFFREYSLATARKYTAKESKPHQKEALYELAGWYKNSSAGARGAILVLPTGGGKTFTALRFLCSHPISDGFKVLWLAHTHHLLAQAIDAFKDSVATIREPMSNLSVRVVSGATGHFKVQDIESSDDVVIGSLQAIYKAVQNRQQCLNEFVRSAMGKLFVVFDEAHHSPAPSYRRLLQQLRQACPEVMLLGLTATPTYTDEKKSGWLTKLFPQGIVHQATANALMQARILARPRFEEARTEIAPDFANEDYSKWVVTNQDVPEHLVTELAKNQARNEFIAAYYATHRARLGKTIIFADRWYQCEAIATFLRNRGVKAEAIYDHTTIDHGTPEERQKRTATHNSEVIEQFKRNELKVLVNIRMLTEGTDVPDLNTVFLTRQTTSSSLLLQMIGRALRGPAVGGTEEAFIVSFIDDWKQRINWAEYTELPEGGLDKEPTEDAKRLPLQLISIDLIRRLAILMDSGENANTAPFRTFLPVGWFQVEINALVTGTDDTETINQMILVYEHDKPKFDHFIGGLQSEDLKELEDAAVEQDRVRVRLQGWERKFFSSGERIGLTLKNDLFSVARHMAQNEKKPPRYFEFQDRGKHDLDAIARRFITEKLDQGTIDKSLKEEFARKDLFWNAIYARYAQFKSAYDSCNNYVLAGGSDASKAGAEPPYTEGKRKWHEPSSVTKEQVKRRDRYKCLCCGSTQRLQIDHIDPSYHGGADDFENLQTLCSICNGAKAIRKIDFRVSQTSLLKAPDLLPDVSLTDPASGQFLNMDAMERILRRWINFFYECAAVDTIFLSERNGRLGIPTIQLFPGNDLAWVTPHIPSLIQRMNESDETGESDIAPEESSIESDSDLARRYAKNSDIASGRRPNKSPPQYTGRTLGMGCQETYAYVFHQNSMAPKEKKMTDVQIADWMKTEFPRRTSKIAEPEFMPLHRKHYNLERRRPSDPISVEYDDRGNEV